MFCVVVADVSGKGMPAALYVQKMQGILQASTDRFTTAKELLIHLQTHLGSTLGPSSFITAVAAVFDPGRSVAEIVRAGHLPVLLRRGRRVQEIKPSGLWLGKSDFKSFGQALQTATIDLKAGDILLFFTDGIVETNNPRGVEFGLQRLKKLVSHSNGSARSLVSQCFKGVRAFAQRSPVLDDKTLVAVKISSMPKGKL